MKGKLMTEAEVSAGLARLPGWELEGRSIGRTLAFPSYLEGIQFVNRLAAEAEAMNHHPDLLIGWRKVTVRLTTHSAGGVTALDFALAEKVDSLADGPG